MFNILKHFFKKNDTKLKLQKIYNEIYGLIYEKTHNYDYYYSYLQALSLLHGYKRRNYGDITEDEINLYYKKFTKTANIAIYRMGIKFLVYTTHNILLLRYKASPEYGHNLTNYFYDVTSKDEREKILKFIETTELKLAKDFICPLTKKAIRNPAMLKVPGKIYANGKVDTISQLYELEALHRFIFLEARRVAPSNEDTKITITNLSVRVKVIKNTYHSQLEMLKTFQKNMNMQ